MKKKCTILAGLLMILLALFSTLAAAREETVSINALECVCCGGWNVVLCEEVTGTVCDFTEKYVGSHSGYCIYCHKTQILKDYKYCKDYYQSVYKYHECLDCGWRSEGWAGTGTYLYSECLDTYSLCSICGGRN